MKVLFLTNVPSPYRVDFFNELGKYCDLTVLFEKETSTERDKTWKNYSFDNFQGIILKGLSVGSDTSLCLSVKKYLKSRMYEIIICTNFTSPTGMYAVRYMKKHRIPYILESDGGFAKSGSGFREKLKSYFIEGAQLYLSTSDIHDEYYIKYGAEPDRIVRYPFSSIREERILKSVITTEDKGKLKKRLGLTEEKIIISVGQFIHRKGFDILLESAKNFTDSVGIYLIGGCPTEEYLNIKSEFNLENVHFLEFKKPDELSEYYKAADLFVLPTREDIWGLVINEAMAYALPIITTDRCLAGVEMIKNGENGYIVPVEDSQKLTEAILEVITDNKLTKQMSENNLNKSYLYTIETMVNKHLKLFNQIEKGN